MSFLDQIILIKLTTNQLVQSCTLTKSSSQHQFNTQNTFQSHALNNQLTQLCQADKHIKALAPTKFDTSKQQEINETPNPEWHKSIHLLQKYQ